LGRVVDFLDVYCRSYHWPTFNLADSAIVVGAGFLVFQLLFLE
jgi:signal peptidase II